MTRHSSTARFGGPRLRTLAIVAVVFALAVTAMVRYGLPSANAAENNQGTVQWNLGAAEQGTASRTAYQQMIQQMRGIASRPFRQDVNETVQDNSLTFRVEVTLAQGSTTGTLTLIYRAQDMYLLGWIGADGTMYQFKDSGLGGTDVPFNENYSELERQAGTTRLDLNYGPQTLLNSLITVFNYNGDNSLNQQTARALLTVVGATAEAARFRPIEETVATGFESGGNAGLSPEQIELENNWGLLSRYGRQITDDPTTPPVRVGQTEFNSFNTLAAVVAVILSVLASAADEPGLPGGCCDITPNGEPGQDNPGEGNPGDGNPGEGNPGGENPGEDNPDEGDDVATFSIKGVGSGKCVDLAEVENGASPTLQDCNGTDRQKFFLDEEKLKTNLGGTEFCLSNNLNHPEGTLFARGCNTPDTLKWTFEPSSEWHVNNTNLCLDAREEKADNGTEVMLFKCSGPDATRPNQQWENLQ